MTPHHHPYQCGGTHIETENSNFLSFSLEISNCHLILKVLNQISCLPVLNTNLKPIYQRWEGKDPSSFTFFISRDYNKSPQASSLVALLFFFNDMKQLMFISPSFYKSYLFLAVLGFGAAQAVSSCGERGLLFALVCRHLTARLLLPQITGSRHRGSGVAAPRL